ncbi:hypothetical protein BG003_005832 [Podila horticola]|nr:hypothetical protein BG003_005832 [Podila horticola]
MMAKLYEDTTYQDVSFAFGEASAGEESVFSRVVEIGAHKHILAQWPYFKAMFESGFVESEPDAKQIRIKDVKPAAFKRAIQFMYMGDLAKEDRPATIFSDALEDEECVSWEDIYVTAHRYDLEDLCHLAKKKIMAGLTKENSVPFLFRSAHFYDDLREPVVKYVASSCVSVITTEDFRSKYLDHPEAAALLYQLFTEQCRAIQPDVAMASK